MDYEKKYKEVIALLQEVKNHTEENLNSENALDYAEFTTNVLAIINRMNKEVMGNHYEDCFHLISYALMPYEYRMEGKRLQNLNDVWYHACPDIGISFMQDVKG